MKRQIVVIMTDTQRKDMISRYSGKTMRTPSLDKLADEGLRFENAYCAQPLCGPARAAIFTGTYPHTNGSWGNSMDLGENFRNIGRRLSEVGMKTAYMGKWHLDGGDYFGKGVCPEGFDPNWWFDEKVYLEELSEKDRKKSRKPATSLDPTFGETKTFGYRTASKAVEFLEKHGDEDFFLGVSFDEPHDPFICPPKYSAPFLAPYKMPANAKENLKDKPLTQRLWQDGEGSGVVRTQVPVFFGCNSFVDAQIGRVMDSIDRIAPNALVIYTSDHGDLLGAHGLSSKGPSMYEEITNIPFIVRWPERVKKGNATESLASHIDIVPTIMEAAGLPLPETLEGKSLIPVLENPQESVNDVVFMEYGRYEIDHDGFGGFQPIRCAFDGRYKLAVNLLDTDEFYDLEQDPGENHNLIHTGTAKIAARRDRLHDTLLDWMYETRDPFRGYHWRNRPWRDDVDAPSWDDRGLTRSRPSEAEDEPPLDYATGLPVKEMVRKK